MFHVGKRRDSRAPVAPQQQESYRGAKRPGRGTVVADTMDFSGKVAVIMGAGKGLGQTLVRRFAEAGANVAFFARSQSSIDLCNAAGRGTGAPSCALSATRS